MTKADKCQWEIFGTEIDLSFIFNYVTKRMRGSRVLCAKVALICGRPMCNGHQRADSRLKHLVN